MPRGLKSCPSVWPWGKELPEQGSLGPSSWMGTSSVWLLQGVLVLGLWPGLRAWVLKQQSGWHWITVPGPPSQCGQAGVPAHSGSGRASL